MTTESDSTDAAHEQSVEPHSEDPAQTSTEDSTDDHQQDDTTAGNRRLSISVSARTLAYGALVAALVAALATFVWLYIDARRQIDAKELVAQNNVHAEKESLDYAVSAATMNYQDLGGWKAKLVAGTSPELNTKLTKAAESMQQILVPLQWMSNAQPLVAKVRSNTGGVYVVDCFVSVQTKTMQAPDPLQSTATYSLTLDSNKNWQITDVGGIGAVVGQK
ncbi:hypothetical protein [Mycolicibacterium sp. lyk4-40-TYG-92]|uniref:hypothetical protein n=1 Tax=Mycolicibacterium sp. lyk4-40-TYG-92 TaxID=3040295 RepID=UPI002550FE6C|nr:hypothetical protein [Mycolicibacterium sp. lyk4-40-TYG-92]